MAADKNRTLQTNFSAGQLDDNVLARSDLAAYQNGAQSLLNMRPTIAGPADTRPGTRLLGQFDDDGWLVDFEFSEDQQYILLFGEGNIKIFDVSGMLLTTVTGGHWALAETRQLAFDRIGDTMFITGCGCRPQILTRTGASTFTLTDFEFDNDPNTGESLQPFHRYAPANVTLTPSDITGSITLTTSEPYWQTGHVGTIVRYRLKQVLVTAVNTTTVAVGTVIDELPQSVEFDIAAAADPKNGTANGSQFDIDEIVYGEVSGARSIIRYKSGNTVQCDVLSGDYDDSANPETVAGLTSDARGQVQASSVVSINPVATEDWDESAFSKLRGWPGSVVFRNSRLWFGGSLSIRPGIWGSRASSVYNFDAADGSAASAISHVLLDSKVGEIRHLVSGQHLQIHTDQGEFYVAETEDTPITPENFNPLRQGSLGSIKSFRPFSYDGATVFAQKYGKAIREARWSDVERKYKYQSLTFLTSSFVSDPIAGAVLYGIDESPESVALILRANGELAVYHAIDEQNIAGWVPWVTSEPIQSVAAVGSQAFIYVRRLVGGVVKYQLEVFDLAVTMDSCVEIGAASRTGLTGMTMFAGKTVSVVELANGEPRYPLGSFEVSASGVIDFGGIVTTAKLLVGYPFMQQVQPMPIEFNTPQGPVTMLPKRIVSLSVSIKSTLFFRQQGLNVIARNNELAPIAQTAVLRFQDLGYDERLAPVITNEQPLKMSVQAVSAEVLY